MLTEAATFIHKVYSMLEDEDYDDAISWNQDGDGFNVKDIPYFQSKILPSYFKHSNFASFVRQLNMYDFHKTEKNHFKHDLFRKDCKDLLPQIKRKQTTELMMPQTIELIEQEVQKLVCRNSELEKLLKLIIRQSDKLKKENSYLWGEIVKQNNEKQQEKLLRWVSESILKQDYISQEQFFNQLEKHVRKKDVIKLILVAVKNSDLKWDMWENGSKKVKTDMEIQFEDGYIL